MSDQIRLAAHLLLKTPHFISALGLMHLTKLHVVLRSVTFRSCIDFKNAFATVGFTRVCAIPRSESEREATHFSKLKHRVEHFRALYSLRLRDFCTIFYDRQRVKHPDSRHAHSTVQLVQDSHLVFHHL